MENSLSMPKLDLVVVTGPSGAGKTEITNTCIGTHSDELIKFITTTDRELRETEQEGKDYYRLPPSVFQQHLQQEKFFEAEEVYENGWYGFSREELKRIQSQKKHAVAVADVNGALKFLGKKQSGFIDLEGISVKVIYIASKQEDMIARIRKDIEQGKRNDSEEKIQKRIKRMEYELSQMVYFDNIIRNEQGKFEFALNEFLNMVFH